MDVFWERLPAKAANYSLQGEDGATLVLCLDPKGQSLGESLMPNISEWPNAADVCLLSQVLERDSIQQKFYLSGKACAGILRRAEARGKKLPEALEKALQAQALPNIDQSRAMEQPSKQVAATLEAEAKTLSLAAL